jgi:ubiquinone/menaquinone biosynthesis C-methylase UbiE
MEVEMGGESGNTPVESSLEYTLTCLWFRLRDLFSPPKRMLDEIGVRPGFRLLDYGCGPGSYSVVAADLVGPSGKVYAADINPLALRRVRRVATSKGWGNIETIHTDCATELENENLDVVLLYDTYHDLENPDCVLEELHRVLKPDSILSFSDHHMEEELILDRITGGGLFRLLGKGRKTYTFQKVDQKQAR